MIKATISSFIFLFLLPFQVFAAEEFATAYDVTYDVGEDGVTTVTQKVTLRNLTSQYYATQFKINIGATQLSDIKASDSSGPMEVSTEQKGSSTTINVKFNQQVAGINKQLPWTIHFKSKDFARKLGKVWEVSVPKTAATTNLEGYNLTLAVPLAFGDPTLISPAPRTHSVNFNKLFLTFDKEQLQSAGVSASFGSVQLFNFDLDYHLENDGLVPIVTSIALPPDTAYQDVVFQRIDPKPMNVTIDEDGNYLAWFKLDRRSRLSVKAVGSARLYSASKARAPTLDPKQQAKYTKADKYWEKDNPTIKTKLSEILGKEPHKNGEKARLIHRYITQNLKYDPSRLSNEIERLGAVTALNNPNSAVCMEFTDLFIALARAAGVPARELDGYAFTDNPSLRPLSLSRDILHAWPEYFDETRGWVMVDPTWENTTGGVDYFNKLDLNHFVFAIKGASSEKPVPAGSYKYRNQETKDVKIVLSESDFLGKPQLDVKLDLTRPLYAGFPNKLVVKIENLGNSTFPSSELSVKAEKLNILDTGLSKLGAIPAFGNAQFEYNVRTKSLLDSFDDSIRVNIDGLEFTQPISIRPFFTFPIFTLVVGSIFLSMVLIYLVVLSGYIYKKRKVSRNI